MLRLGFRLAVNSGREALTRLLLTMVSVAVGVVILLAVFADFHAFQASNNKPNWESTAAASGQVNNTNAELWNYSNDVFKGQTIKRVDVAALGPQAPVLSGISKMPAAGEYYVSPALDKLLKTTPVNELGNRFPGKEVGVMSDQALSTPDDLVVFIGQTPAGMATFARTITVTQIGKGPQTSVWTNYFRYAFAIGAVAFLFPIIILIGMATRLAAERREERYAALRLIGASSRQMNVIASVDAIVGSFLGVLLGIGIFALVQPAWARTAVLSTHFFAYDVTPTLLGYISLLVAVPVVSTATALLALRRVRISPLGVSRKATPRAPRLWRMAPLALGVVLYVIGLATTNQQSIGGSLYLGVLFILIGLVFGGSWMTMQAARALSVATRGAATLLAARRLANNPKAAFRAANGLVLAVFLGTVVAGLLPAINATMKTPSANALNNVIYDNFQFSPVCGNTVNCSGGKALAAHLPTDAEMAGLPPSEGAKLIKQLQSFAGVLVVPIYHNSAFTPPHSDGPGVPVLAAKGSLQSYPNIVPCKSFNQLEALGTCAAGAVMVAADGSNLSNDNPQHSTDPFVTAQNPVIKADLSQLSIEGVLVKVQNADSLEQVRTFLATHVTDTASGMAPRTFGEAVQVRTALTATIQRLFYIAIVLTLFVAGCSLAVAVGGGIVERKRPFSLLRITGVQMGVLYKVVLLEAVMPLVTAMVVAGGVGYGISLATISKMAPKGTPLPVPSASYYLIMGIGLVLSLLIILLTLPILRFVTQPDNARFE